MIRADVSFSFGLGVHVDEVPSNCSGFYIKLSYKAVRPHYSSVLRPTAVHRPVSKAG